MLFEYSNSLFLLINDFEQEDGVDGKMYQKRFIKVGYAEYAIDHAITIIFGLPVPFRNKRIFRFEAYSWNDAYYYLLEKDLTIPVQSSDEFVELFSGLCGSKGAIPHNQVDYVISAPEEWENAPYWLHHNWARKYALVHAAECPACNNGQGIHDDVSGDICEWIPFTDEQLALEIAQKLGYQQESFHCKRCPQERRKKSVKPKPVTSKAGKGKLTTYRG